MALRAISPRLILSLKGGEPAHPVRMHSDATGAGKLASVSFISNVEECRWILLAAQADENLHKLATATKEIYIVEFFASIATVFLSPWSIMGKKSDSLRR